MSDNAKEKPGLLNKKLAAAPVLNQEEESRKILENLQLRKNFLQQGTLRPGPTLPVMAVGSAKAQELLASAQAVSPGFYVYQDSKYGNNILPVIPRLKQ
ncbi:unnamed protein product [Notodromas monacha]|uniref:SOSS complex subunit C n=1 Tax=Notodromas monacha TaxID=399045 RepID=A0A7R9BXG2_9CRUS|nr:unnamed protein product [Notodromas monacha]CAG0922422.1 unnamed protein product [Notodromas monacha]